MGSVKGTNLKQPPFGAPTFWSHLKWLGAWGSQARNADHLSPRRGGGGGYLRGISGGGGQVFFGLSQSDTCEAPLP